MLKFDAWIGCCCCCGGGMLRYWIANRTFPPLSHWLEIDKNCRRRRRWKIEMNSKERTQGKINKLLVYLLIRSQIQLHVHSLCSFWEVFKHVGKKWRLERKVKMKFKITKEKKSRKKNFTLTFQMNSDPGREDCREMAASDMCWCLDRIADWINFQNIFFVNLYDTPFSAVSECLVFWFYFQQKQKNKFPNTRKKKWGDERKSSHTHEVLSVVGDDQHSTTSSSSCLIRLWLLQAHWKNIVL